VSGARRWWRGNSDIWEKVISDRLFCLFFQRWNGFGKGPDLIKFVVELQGLHEANDDRLYFIQAILEKVVGSRYGYHAFGRGHLFKPFRSQFIRGNFIFGTVNNEFGFLAALKCLPFKHASGYAKADNRLNAVINTGDTQPDIGTK